MNEEEIDGELAVAIIAIVIFIIVLTIFLGL
jgi:hypothetical protein